MNVPRDRDRVPLWEKLITIGPVLLMLATLLWNTAQASRKQEEIANSLLEIKMWMASRDERWATTNLDVKTMSIEMRGDIDQVKYRVSVLEQAASRAIPSRRGTQ